MADPEHLALLKKDLDDWEDWRAENPSISPDLSKANLRRASLNYVNFSSTDLSYVNFKDAFLRAADFDKASLVWADFTEAWAARASFTGTNLRNAILTGTDLYEANFRNANLTEEHLNNANLIKADLTGANLSGADVKDANLTEADFLNADLREARLIGSILRDAKNLSIEQLSQVRTLHNAVIERSLRKQIKKHYPHLLRKPGPITYENDTRNEELNFLDEEVAKGRLRPVFPQIIGIGMLLWALNPSNPYGYYILLRWVCCAIFAYLAFRAYEIEKTPWVWILGVIAWIYNPIIRAPLAREIWTLINVITIVILIATLVVLKGEAKTGESI